MKKLFIALILLFNVVYAEENESLDIEKWLLSNETELNQTEDNNTYETNTTGEYVEPVNSGQIRQNINGYYLVIEDDANLLTESQISLLINDMKPLTEYGHVIFKTINYNDTTTEKYANNYYYSNFGNENGSMFLIDMYRRYIYIVSGGNNFNAITESKSEIITDNAYRYASSKDYYKCASVAFGEMYKVLAGQKINEPMRYISNICLSLVTGFFACFLYVLAKTRIKPAGNAELVNNCENEMTVKSIEVTPAGIHKVYSPVSESSGSSSHGGGGGFHGGGGGGGGFHGGGGGHRF